MTSFRAPDPDPRHRPVDDLAPIHPTRGDRGAGERPFGDGVGSPAARLGRSRADDARERGAWVEAVARALIELDDRHAADSASDLWSLRREASASGALRPDLAHAERLIVQAVVGLPAVQRDLVLGRYRDGHGVAELARRHGLRRRDALELLGASLGRIGVALRAGLGGSGAVQRAALDGLATRQARPTPRRRRVRSAAVAAVVTVAALALGLWSGLDERESLAPRTAVAAAERTEPSRSPSGARPDDDAPPTSAEARGADLIETARQIEEFLLRGRVVRIGDTRGDSERRLLGQVRVMSAAGRDRVALIDRDGGFSVPGLTPGEWRVTARLRGYETVERQVVVEAGEPPAPIVLEAHRAQELDVLVFDREGAPLFDLPGYADDWTLTHGLSVWLGRAAPGEREQPEGSSSHLWNRLGEFERLHPIDMARPEVVGSLHVERPRDLEWVALLYGDRVVDARPWTSGVEALAFEVDPSELEALRSGVAFTLTSLLGRDVAGAEVRLYGPNGEVRLLRVGADGVLRLDGLPPGRWWMSVELADHGLLKHAFEIGPGLGDAVGELELAAPIDLSGTINIKVKSGQFSSEVTAIGESLLEEPWSFQSQPQTDSVLVAGGEEGSWLQKFSFQDLSGDGSWVVVLDHPKHALSAIEVTSATEALDFTPVYGADVTLHWDASSVGGDKLMLLLDGDGLPLKVLEPNADLAATIKLEPLKTYYLSLWSDGGWGKSITIDGVQYGGHDVDVDW